MRRFEHSTSEGKNRGFLVWGFLWVLCCWNTFTFSFFSVLVWQKKVIAFGIARMQKAGKRGITLDEKNNFVPTLQKDPSGTYTFAQGSELNLFSSLPLPPLSLPPLLRPLPLTFLPTPHNLLKRRSLVSARFLLAAMLGHSAPVTGIEGSGVVCEVIAGLEARGVGGAVG